MMKKPSLLSNVELKRKLYIGIMSGTSMDGIDAVILDLDSNRIIEHDMLDFPNQLHLELSNLIIKPTASLALMGELDIQLAILYSQLVNNLLKKASIAASEIIAIGCHGQTVFHQPEGEYRFSTQLGSGHYLAELTSITSVMDFRNRDIAAGGQGAPLVPGFHQYMFSDKAKNRLLINIGGIANCSWLPITKEVSGYDIGPGNTLMDVWIQQCCDKSYDDNGYWAASGHVSDRLLKQLRSDHYFNKSVPKTTGREYFNLKWLNSNLALFGQEITESDIQATLLMLTATTIADCINHFSPDQTFLCGGGVKNTPLISQIKQLSLGDVFDITELGMDAEWVEASAFAWLAKCCIEKSSGALCSVTGARYPVISGVVYLA